MENLWKFCPTWVRRVIARNKASPIAFLLLAATLTLALQYFLWSHVSDDAYISFRYIDRLIEGKGLTFNDGERVEGFSHPLWILLIAGCAQLTGLAVPDVARGLGLGFSISTIALVFASRRFLGSRVACLAIVLLAVFPGFHVYATSGLETPLFMFLLTVGVVSSIARREPTTLSSLSFGAAAIARPEGLLYGLFGFGARRRQFAILLGPFIAYEIFRRLYFEAWLPNVFRAKLPGTFGSSFGLAHLWQSVAAAGGPLLVGALLSATRNESEDLRKVFRAAVGPILASIVFVFYAWGDWMPFSRFIVPVWPSIALLLASAIVALRRFLWIGTLVVAGILGVYSSSIQRYARNEGLDSMLMRGEDPLAVGVWLSKAVKPGGTVRTARIGGMSYGAPELTFWDENGLTDREQAIWIFGGRVGGAGASPISARDPDVVAALLVPASWSYTEDEKLLEWLDAKYSLVSKFPQGNYGEVHVWLQKSQPTN